MDTGNSTLPGLPFDLPLPAEPAPPDPNAERCHLLGPTALVVQAVMGVMVISSLVLKRQLETRRRKWRVWVLDVGKQLVGQAVIHGLNILISSVVADAGDKNPCSLYFLNILIDTTVGIAILWFALRFYTKLFIKHYGPEGYISGQYGHPPQWKFWLRQLQPYLLAAVTMKLVVLLPLTLPRISAALILFGQGLLSFLSLDVQVIFVLAVFPLIMNVFQFCVVDQVIKAGKHADPKRHASSGGDDDDEVDDVDLDEDNEGYRPLATREADIEAYPTTTSAASANANAGVSGYPSSPRRRTSSVRGSAPGSRSNSFVGSVPGSPLLAPEQRGLLSDNVWTSVSSSSTSSRRTPIAREDTDASAVWTQDRDRRSDAPSPDGDVFVAEAAEASAVADAMAPPSPLAVSRLSMEAQRNARRELSPPRQKRRGREDGVGLHAI